MFGIRVTGWGNWSRVLAIISVLLVLVALGALVYVTVSPPNAERFTEFYILGPEGGVGGYPEELAVGEEGRVVMGIVNWEQETVTYRVDVVIDGVRDRRLEPVTLGHGEEWQGIVGFTPDRMGSHQKVEFLLYRTGQDDVYRRLHLWVGVR